MGGKAALVLVLGFAFVFAYVSQNLSGLSRKAVGNVSLYASASESHNLAVSAANIALAKFYQDTTWRGTAVQSFQSAGALHGSLTYCTIDMPGSNLKLRGTSSVSGGSGILRDTVEIYLDTRSTNSFTLFAWMTNEEGNVFWIDRDTVWGRVHSNGNLHINGSPVFMEKVTTAKGIDPKPGVGADKGIFKNGYETGVATIAFPTDLSELLAASTSGGRKYVGNITVALSQGSSADNDGFAIVTAGALQDTIRLSDPGFNGAILGTGIVSVSGTLDGRLTIGSLTDIHVLDNIRYENRNTASSNDMLGLVANNKVIVANNTANSHDCEIDASIFARTGSFTAEDYNEGDPRGVLHVLGSIVQNTRGPVGTFSGSSIRTGYSKRYLYDIRLNDNSVRPPFYPGFSRKTYKIAGWWENVRVPAWWD